MSLVKLMAPDADVLARRDAIVADLKKIAGPEAVIDDEDGRRTFETDGLSAYRCMPMAVVLPTTTQGVADVMRYCQNNGVPVVPRGAGTSLCGAALPREDAIVVGVSRMNKVLDINYDNRIATVEAGITNLAITEAVADRGFFYAPDPSSQLACTLAGNLAMNSGGAHCLKYGVTTNNVLGVTMVLMNGDIIELGGQHLDADAYDLLGLTVGSEGQFGIITEATVRILRAAEGTRPMLLGFASGEAAGGCVAAIIGAGIIPVAMEFMDRPAIEVCEAFAKAGYPLDVEALLIVEVDGSDAEMSDLLERIAQIAKSYRPSVTLISENSAQSAGIWKGRKSAYGAMGRISDCYCMDGVIPLSMLSRALAGVSEICQKHGLRVANFFHAGDGNLHPVILYDANDPTSAEDAERAGAEILMLCVDLGGCLTGEHGVGIEKRDLMRAQFTETDLALQMRIKSVFDPDWLLNPGKVFPLEIQNAKPGEAA